MNLRSLVLVCGWIDGGGEDDGGLEHEDEGHNEDHGVVVVMGHGDSYPSNWWSAAGTGEYTYS